MCLGFEEEDAGQERGVEQLDVRPIEINLSYDDARACSSFVGSGDFYLDELMYHLYFMYAAICSIWASMY